MASKALLIILDGLGDRPSKKFRGETPLEAASTPNLDFLVREGICGMQTPLGLGFTLESGPAHFEIFGYHPYQKFYPGRGVLEALGCNFKLKEDDIALRVNFATFKNGKIIDRRAGRIKDASIFEEDLSFELEGVEFILKAGTEHRGALILRGGNLSEKISDSDPKKEGRAPKRIKPLDKEAKFTAEILNKYIKKAHEILKSHPENKRRVGKKLPPANFLLLRGAGKYKPIPSFSERYKLKACCIAGAGLYKGFGKYLGMEVLKVKGATGGKDSNIEAKFKAAKKALKKYDFVWVHVKATDLYGHDGDCIGKKEFIERVDKALAKILDERCLKVVTGDHSTPCSLKEHSGDEVPILFHGEEVREDNILHFGERDCMQGGLEMIEGKDIMPEILNLIGKQKVIE